MWGVRNKVETCVCGGGLRGEEGGGGETVWSEAMAGSLLHLAKIHSHGWWKWNVHTWWTQEESGFRLLPLATSLKATVYHFWCWYAEPTRATGTSLLAQRDLCPRWKGTQACDNQSFPLLNESFPLWFSLWGGRLGRARHSVKCPWEIAFPLFLASS